jgi:hypothetical protein
MIVSVSTLGENFAGTESNNQRLIGLGLPLTERQSQHHIYFFGQYSSRSRVCRVSIGIATPLM